MKIKKFEADEVSEALRAIREELGPDAVILSTRELDHKKAGIPFRKKIEVTAAVEFSPPQAETAHKEQSKFDQMFQDLIPKIEKGEEILSIKDELRSIKEAIQYLQKTPELDKNQFYGRLYEVCKDLKKITVESKEKAELDHLHENFIRLYERLLSNGVDHQTALSLVKLMNEKISPGEAEKKDFFTFYLEEVIRGMAQKLLSYSSGKEDSSLTMLVGPSGVGKTTTLAKLAAQKNSKNQNSVIVTLDTLRIGAVAQLNALGRKIGVPVYATSSVSELKGMISRRKKSDFIFIDTPGENHKNLNNLFELSSQLKHGFPLVTHLVLSAHTRQDELDQMIDRFSAFSVDRFIITKTDETRRFGHLLTLMRKKRKAISYLTMGQRVPEDIEVATPKRVAELILSKEVKNGEVNNDPEYSGSRGGRSAGNEF
ncbi:MAG: flagellar biosynthesis protein FlhF [Nitrospiria bacterium]